MYKRLITTHLAIFSTVCLIFVLLANVVSAAPSGQTEVPYTLNDVKTEVTDESLTITMFGSSAPAFTSRELYDPYRLIIDIAVASLSEKLELGSLISENKFVTLQTTVVKGLEPEITRFIFTIEHGYRQKVERSGNDLVINFLPLSGDGQDQVANKSAAVKGGTTDSVKGSAENGTDANTILQDLIATSSSSSQNGNGNSGDPATTDLANSFEFSGYTKERISIDFYKIDLHNVFRLFRQVSGLNLIVDQGVSGSITLALNDVPWDFALDIILNLAELEKEERFNTIIIYKKDKGFVWPERTADNLSFEADLEVIEQEALIIEHSANQPKEIMQAKELMRKARIEEKNDDFEDAVSLYVEASELWPDNSNLTKRIAALYLVRLGMNAKAVFYAKKSLEVQPDNYKAALYAAIGMANMNKIPEAVEYFSQSISGSPPMKEALASFAAFSESNGRQAAALKLYDKYDSIYGETVNTMVAKARIYDSMGMNEKAVEQYKLILASGFQLSTDLKRYIQSRLSESAQ
jgi:type IV pilus assembly protein PilQ